MPLKEVIAKSQKIKDENTIVVKTQKKYFSLVTAFLSWAVNDGFLESSPAMGINISKKGKKGKDREPFTADEIRTLILSPLFTGYLSYPRRSIKGDMIKQLPHYWYFLIALFSGMRLGEIVQLKLQDIIQEKGVVCFSVNTGDDEDKGVKSEAGIRLVPVHAKLIELGLMSWVNKVAKNKPNGIIFPELVSDNKNHISRKSGRHMNKYLENIKLKTKGSGKSFHSLRHSFIDALRDGGVPEYTLHKIVGHAEHDVTSGYGVGTSIPIMKEAIDGCYQDMDFEHLKAMKL